jgi:exoribonuclease-2
VLPVAGAQGLPRGAHVRVRLGDIDLVSLDIHGTVLARLDSPTLQAADDLGEDDDGALAGPIAIAVDIAEGDADAPSAGAATNTTETATP